MKTLIRRGKVAIGEGIRCLDILIEGQRIAAVGEDLDSTEALEISAEGAYVLPGFIDFHTHLNDHIAGFDLSDTFESGSRVAALNGVTTLCGFVTQGPKETLNEGIARTLRKALTNCHVDHYWHLTPTSFSESDWRLMRLLPERGYKTFKLYTTYRNAGIYSDYERIEEIFKRLAPLGLRFLIHAEDDALLCKAAALPMDCRESSSHAEIRTPEAEMVAVQQVMELAKKHRALVHFVHISTLEAARIINETKDLEGVSCETCPQYLWLDESCLKGVDGHRWICSPPLRSEREKFRDRARQGFFTLFASDHCPFHTREKDLWGGKDFRRVPGGLPGIGALPHLVWKLWEDDPDRAALEVALRLSENPARLAGLEHRKGRVRVGLDADLVILEPVKGGLPIQSSLSDCHEVYPGLERTVSIRQVLQRGHGIVEGGRLLAPFRGRFLQE